MFIKILCLNKVGCVLPMVIWSQFRMGRSTLFRRNIWVTTKTLLIFSGSHWILKPLFSGLQLVNSQVCFRPRCWFFVLILDSKILEYKVETRLKKIPTRFGAPVILPQFPFDSKRSLQLAEFRLFISFWNALDSSTFFAFFIGLFKYF